MPNRQHFDILMLIARPAAGKSEIINYLKKVSPVDRIKRFHISEFEEIDDFPMLWTWFEEDQLLTKMGYPRMYTDENGIFVGHHLWDLLIERICLEYAKEIRNNPEYHKYYTTIIEFSRGKEHGGYARAFHQLSQEVIQKLAILYVNVSLNESIRKNRARYNPMRPDSILEHGLPDEKMETLYKDNDWEEISGSDPHYIKIRELKVPYIVFENEDDVTSERGEELGKRLEFSLQGLWDLYNSIRANI
ncbi:MAG: hypothetical protein MUO67_11395 [Anaerolineales bacterium]|nr:hypothetical protein [Anaerolineales bacterium]